MTNMIVPPSALRLLDLLPQWVTYLKTKGRRPRGIVTYEKEARYLIAALGGPTATVADLTWEKLALHQANLAERGLSAASLNKRICVARSLCAWLVKTKQLDHNFALELESPKRPKALPRPLSTAEAHGLWSLMTTPIESIRPARRWTWARDIRAVALCLLGGLRLAEMAALQWKHIDLDAGIIHVIAGKGGKDRTLPIALQLRPFLEAVPLSARKAAHAVAGRRDGRCLSHKAVPHIMDRFIRKALPDVHFHRLRHNFASALYNAGADLFAIQELLGHESPETTRMYVRCSTEHTRRAVALLPDIGSDLAPSGAVAALRAQFAPPAPMPTRPIVPGVCPQCDAPFPQPKHGPTKVFCSLPCGVRYRREHRAAA
jgi:site-specific recombinase XerC